MFQIEYGEGVVEDIKSLSAGRRKQVLDKMEEQLVHEPDRETRNKKVVVGLKAPWLHEEPMCELRIGEYRVFYDVDVSENRVVVRAIRHKPPHKTTEEIL